MAGQKSQWELIGNGASNFGRYIEELCVSESDTESYIPNRDINVQ